MNLFCVCCSCNLFSLLIYVLQKLQRAELFSKFSIPQDTQIISTILGENEQCFPNTSNKLGLICKNELLGGLFEGRACSRGLILKFGNFLTD